MSNHSFTRDDVNLIDYSNAIKFILFLGNAKERHVYIVLLFTVSPSNLHIVFHSSSLCANRRLPCISITQSSQRK